MCLVLIGCHNVTTLLFYFIFKSCKYRNLIVFQFISTWNIQSFICVQVCIVLLYFLFIATILQLLHYGAVPFWAHLKRYGHNHPFSSLRPTLVLTNVYTGCTSLIKQGNLVLTEFPVIKGLRRGAPWH